MRLAISIRRAILAVPLLFSPAAGQAEDAVDALLYGTAQAREDLAAACFARHYDQGHLMRSPQQNVTDMVMLSYRPGPPGAANSILNFELRFREAAEPLQLSGECRPSSEKEGMLDCSFECDGGTFTLQRGDDRSVFLDLPDGSAACDADGGLPEGANFGSDDKRFRLYRSDLAECAGLIWDDEIKPRLLEKAGEKP